MLIYLVRHGESEWVKYANSLPEPHFGGQMPEVPLTDDGLEEASALGRYFGGAGIRFVHRVSSPYRRAQQTMVQSTRMVPGASLVYDCDPRFVEMNWGLWTGQPRSVLKDTAVARERRRRGLRFRPPQGESYADVQKRFLDGVYDLAGKYPGIDTSVLVTTHQNVIKACLALAYPGMSLDDLEKLKVPPVSITIIEAGPRRNVELVGLPSRPFTV